MASFWRFTAELGVHVRVSFIVPFTGAVDCPVRLPIIANSRHENALSFNGFASHTAAAAAAAKLEYLATVHLGEGHGRLLQRPMVAAPSHSFVTPLNDNRKAFRCYFLYMNLLSNSSRYFGEF